MRSDSPKSTERSTSASVVRLATPASLAAAAATAARSGLARPGAGSARGSAGEAAHGVVPVDDRVSAAALVRPCAGSATRHRTSKPTSAAATSARPRSAAARRVVARACASARPRLRGARASRRFTASSGSSPSASATVRTKPRAKPSGVRVEGARFEPLERAARDVRQARELVHRDPAQAPLPREIASRPIRPRRAAPFSAAASGPPPTSFPMRPARRLHDRAVRYSTARLRLPSET